MINGKTVLITGAASGIGAACAAAYGNAGANVVATDLRANGSILALDVKDPDSWERLISNIGQIDILHLNAGGWTPGYSDMATPPEVPLSDVTLDAWRTVFSVNVDGVFNGIKAVLPQMVERRSGDILVTASMAGLLAPPGDIGYGATKHAIVGLVLALAQALERKGVNIAAICPASVDTPMVSPAMKAMMREIGMPVSSVQTIVAASFQALRTQKNGGLWSVFGDRINRYEPPSLTDVIDLSEDEFPNLMGGGRAPPLVTEGA
jgi:NAD(P)-dependent dehydrogenase (short-subunit alcohol dehydrogenase family)